ncbi:MAG: hypothetical protein Ct9H300mP14_04200 [Gammaproteobacteria bacterium]|nr:MAG: hypothetical protein Ct9H300mP14_04200 [Gammaproteobacteria bacterium]
MLTLVSALIRARQHFAHRPAFFTDDGRQVHWAATVTKSPGWQVHWLRWALSRVIDLPFLQQILYARPH